MALLNIRSVAQSLVNDATVAVYGEAMTYTDTEGNSEAIEAIFDEEYELVDSGDDGAELTMTTPAISCRVSDFDTTTAEIDGRLTIGSRSFVVASVERSGDGGLVLTLNERL